MEIKRIKGVKRRHLAEKFAQMGFTKGVEIGTCHGKYAQVLCSANPKLDLTTVDPYVAVYQDPRTQRIGDAKQESLYKEARERLRSYKCKIIRKHSLEASFDFPYESIDFVYIDGSHEFDYVICDIIEWAKRVKKGGIVSGHDYTKDKMPAVYKAVNIYAEEHDIPMINITDERSPSWWFERTW